MRRAPRAPGAGEKISVFRRRSQRWAAVATSRPAPSQHDEHQPHDDRGYDRDDSAVAQQLTEEASRSTPWALARTRAPLVENGLTSTMVEDTAMAAMKPMAPTPEPAWRNGTASGIRAKDRGRRGEGRDDGTDEAQQQRASIGESRPATPWPTNRWSHPLEHEDISADTGDQHDPGQVTWPMARF